MSVARIGLVGLGPRARTGWIKSLQMCERAEMVAACDHDPVQLAKGAAVAGLAAENLHDDLDDLLKRDDVDAVTIVVGTEFQPDIALRALAAGKHVLCEVPLSFDLDACWDLVLAVERTGLQFALAEQTSHTPFITAWTELARDGALGAPLYAEAQYIHRIDDYWRDPRSGDVVSFEAGAAMADAEKTRFWAIEHPIWYNPHSLAPLVRVLDTHMTEVTCMASGPPSHRRKGVPISDLEVAMMRAANGAMVRVAVGFGVAAPLPWHWYHVLGTEGRLETDRYTTDPMPNTWSSWFEAAEPESHHPQKWTSSPNPQNDSNHDGHDLAPIDDFVSSVLDGHPPLVDIYRAANIAAAGILAGRSADQGAATLPIPDFRPGAARETGVDSRSPANA